MSSRPASRSAVFVPWVLACVLLIPAAGGSAFAELPDHEIHPAGAESWESLQTKLLEQVTDSADRAEPGELRPKGSSTPRVHAIYLVPSDRPVRADYRRAIRRAVEDVRAWYQRELGTTEAFRLTAPVVEVVETLHPAAYYSTNPNGDEALWFWNNAVGDGLELTGGSFNDLENLWVFYIDAQHRCGQLSAAGTSGVMLLPALDLLGLTGQQPRPACFPIHETNPGRNVFLGGLAHEIAHAFGLPHPPGCDEGLPSCDEGAITWRGLFTFPDTYLRDPEREALSETSFFLPGPWCEPSTRQTCLASGRFHVRLDWRDFQDRRGDGRIVPGGSDDSGLLWFFDGDNWEMLVKVLDACGFNDRFWVFAAATTNVEYTLRVTDSLTGRQRAYTNPLGRSAPALTDTGAFATCDTRIDDAVAAAGTRRRSEATPGGEEPSLLAPLARPVPTAEKGGRCTDTGTELCLGGRFLVEVEWRDFEGKTGSGRVVPLRSEDSGLFWFFHRDNWEMLLKVLDGCGFNDHFWVFAAATTTVEYTLRVEDTETGRVRIYRNPLGQAAEALTDTGAFRTCP